MTSVGLSAIAFVVLIWRERILSTRDILSPLVQRRGAFLWIWRKGAVMKMIQELLDHAL